MASVKVSLEPLPDWSFDPLVMKRWSPPLRLGDPIKEPEEVTVPLLDLGEQIVPGLSYRIRLGAYCPTGDANDIRIVYQGGAFQLREHDALRHPTLLTALYAAQSRLDVLEHESRALRDIVARLRLVERESEREARARYAESWTERWGWE